MEDGPRMYLVGARFPDQEDAARSLAELRSCLDIGPDDAGVEAMGTTDYEDPMEAALLAGRFRPDRLALVEQVIARNGGAIVLEKSEG
jgi:hypothetical protein